MKLQNPKVAGITGIIGHEGSYLAELLLEKRYVAYGIKRRSRSLITQRVDHIYLDPNMDNANFKLNYDDQSDASNATRIIWQVQPDEMIILSELNHVGVSIYSP